MSRVFLLVFTRNICHSVHMTVGLKSAVRRSRARILAVWIASFALVGGVLVTVPAQASVPQSIADSSVASALSDGVKTADLSKFNPGNIISDAVFFNSNTMTEAQIQAFLESKVPTCRSGYTCLKDWYDTSRSTGSDAMCGSYSGGVRERASAIIYKVAKACGINPQVILATLEKEQGLVTHVWPSEWRYTIAMGQGCPDTAACDTRYYGFFNQVYGAAWQFKRYANPPGTSQYFTWYAPGKTWNIRWNPNEACGSSPVYVENQATANLYYFTPYQPNAAAIRAGYGEGDGCSSYGNRNFYQRFTDWFGSTQGTSTVNDPFGAIDVLEVAPGEYRVAGWAADPDTKEPIAVHIYVGNVGTPLTADRDRPDVGAAYPKVGSRHGFDTKVAAQGGDNRDICVFAINVAVGGNTLLGCRTVTPMSGSPVGALDSLQAVDGGIEYRGWAIDPDTTGSIAVHAYVDGVGTPLTADNDRPDLVPHYPAYGSRHGYSGKATTGIGSHTVCLYAINVGAGTTTTLACRQIVVASGPDTGRAPTGNYESLTVDGDTATVTGWAVDPDTAASIKVHIYVGSSGKEYTADKARGDVGNAFPGYGANHGFSEKVSIPVGSSNVCIYAINTAGPHTLLGCRTAVRQPGRPPVGNYESITATSGGLTVSGWALDPDTSSSIAVHVYVDGAGTPFTADLSRPDVARSYPANGELHGFSKFIPAASGVRQACIWAIDSAGGSNTYFGCRTVTVP